jgi:hypothetical protein
MRGHGIVGARWPVGSRGARHGIADAISHKTFVRRRNRHDVTGKAPALSCPVGGRLPSARAAVMSMVTATILCTSPAADATLINFDNLAAGQDVGTSYEATSGVGFSTGDFTVLTQSQNLNPATVSPSPPNVVLVQPPVGADIFFNSPQSTVSIKYGSIDGVSITAAGPGFTETITNSVPSFPAINQIATFTSLSPSITVLTFNSDRTGNAAIDDLVFSTVPGAAVLRDNRAFAIDQSLNVAGLVISAIGVAAAPLTEGLSLLADLGQAIALISEGRSLAADPPSSDYTQVFSPVFHQLPTVQADSVLPQSVADAANSALSHGSRALSYLEALDETNNRLTAAQQAGDQASINLQENTLNQYLALATSELSQFGTGLQGVVALLKANGVDLTATTQSINDFLSNLMANGFSGLPQEEQAIFGLFGLDAGFDQGVIDRLLAASLSGVPTSLDQAMMLESADFQDLSAIYAGPGEAASSATVPEPQNLGNVLLSGGTLALIVLCRRLRRKQFAERSLADWSAQNSF